MKCSQCGAEVPDGQKFCDQCGAPLQAAEPTPPLEEAATIIEPPPAATPPAEVAAEIPTPPPPAQPVPPPPPPTPYPAAPSAAAQAQVPTSTSPGTPKEQIFAIASLVLGILGLCGGWALPICSIPAVIAGLVLGIMAIKSPSRGLAIAGVVLCGLAIVAGIVSFAIFGIGFLISLASEGAYY